MLVNVAQELRDAIAQINLNALLPIKAAKLTLQGVGTATLKVGDDEREFWRTIEGWEYEPTDESDCAAPRLSGTVWLLFGDWLVRAESWLNGDNGRETWLRNAPPTMPEDLRSAPQSKAKLDRVPLSQCRLIAIDPDGVELVLNENLYFFEESGISDDSGLGHFERFQIFIEPID
jgi:hypothetical protein